MCAIWDAGRADQPEEEREAQHAWEDALDGEVPGRPARQVDDIDPWKTYDWHDGPEYKLWRRILEDEDGEV